MSIARFILELSHSIHKVNDFIAKQHWQSSFVYYSNILTSSSFISVSISLYLQNVPCKVVYVNADKPGKAILWLWLHGGVHDRPKHDMFYHPNHFDCCDADEYILQYLKESGTKAIALFPVCYKANLTETIKWTDCYDDVKHIIDDYADKGLIDATRIYVTGSSDGGRGAWDYAEMHPDVFAAAISMSCSS